MKAKLIMSTLKKDKANEKLIFYFLKKYFTKTSDALMLNFWPLQLSSEVVEYDAANRAPQHIDCVGFASNPASEA